MRFIQESRVHVRAGYDIPGAVTVTGGFFLLVYGFTMAGTHGWGAPLTLGLLAGAAVALCAFVVIELRSTHPLLPMRVVLDRNRGGSYLASLLVGSALLGTFLFLTYFLQETLGYSVLKTGFAFLPFSGGIIIGAGLATPSAAPHRPAGLDGDRAGPGSRRVDVVHRPERRQHIPGPCPPARRCWSAWVWGWPSSRCPPRPWWGSIPPTPGWPVPSSTRPSRSGGRSAPRS